MGNTQTRENSPGRKQETFADGGLLIPFGIYALPLGESEQRSRQRSTYIAEYKLRIVKQLILSRKLAPFYFGLPDYNPAWSDQQLVEAVSPDQESLDPSRTPPFTLQLYRDAIECPICFLFYPKNINLTRCCTQPICTECFLQIKRDAPHYPTPVKNHPPGTPLPNYTPDDLISEPATCPYCVESNFGVVYICPDWIKFPSKRAGYKSWSQADLSPQISDLSSQSTDTVISALHAGLSPPCRQSYPPTDCRVTTKDEIRPDWKQMLFTKRNRVRKRVASAAARTYTYFLPAEENENTSNMIDLSQNLRIHSLQFEQALIREAVRRSLLDDNSARHTTTDRNV